MTRGQSFTEAVNVETISEFAEIVYCMYYEDTPYLSQSEPHD